MGSRKSARSEQGRLQTTNSGCQGGPRRERPTPETAGDCARVRARKAEGNTSWRLLACVPPDTRSCPTIHPLRLCCSSRVLGGAREPACKDTIKMGLPTCREGSICAPTRAHLFGSPLDSCSWILQSSCDAPVASAISLMTRAAAVELPSFAILTKLQKNNLLVSLQHTFKRIWFRVKVGGLEGRLLRRRTLSLRQVWRQTSSSD